MIKIIDGNLLDATEDVIGHQVNCRGVMGRELALSIKRRYPFVFQSYKDLCYTNYSTPSLMGKCQTINVGSKIIANLFAQKLYGTSVCQTDYDALKESLVKLKRYCVYNNLSLALPYGIGCGLGGGDCDKVDSILEEVFSDYDLTLYRL